MRPPGVILAPSEVEPSEVEPSEVEPKFQHRVASMVKHTVVSSVEHADEQVGEHTGLAVLAVVSSVD